LAIKREPVNPELPNNFALSEAGKPPHQAATTIVYSRRSAVVGHGLSPSVALVTDCCRLQSHDREGL